MFVRLWYQIGGTWSYVDEQLTAVTLVEPGVISPRPFTILAASDVVFRWSGNDQSVSKWWLYIGSTQGAHDVYNSSDLGLNLSHVVPGLPTDGRTLYVRLWYQTGELWQFVDQEVTAATLAAPVVTSPIAGSTLSGSSVKFQWTANNQPISNWWFFVGSSLGARDISNSGDLGTAVSQHVSGLPTDGRIIYVRLWYRGLGVWRFVDLQYTASNS